MLSQDLIRINPNKPINYGSITTNPQNRPINTNPQSTGLYDPANLNNRIEELVQPRSINDHYGNTTHISTNGKLLIATSYRLVGAGFQGPSLASGTWVVTTGNGGSVIQNNNMVILNTNGSGNATGILRSVPVARYVQDNHHYFSAKLQTTNTGNINNIQRWGAYTDTNGCFFEKTFSGINCVMRKNGIDYPNFLHNWNYFQTPIGSGMRVYEIFYRTKGTIFVIDNIQHEYFAEYDTWTNNYSLPIAAENININDGKENTSLMIRSMYITRMGVPMSNSRYRHMGSSDSAMLIKGTAGLLKTIMINQKTSAGNTTLYDGLNNTGSVIAILNANSIQGPMEYNIEFYNGLYIEGNTGDLTIVYE